MTLTVLTEILSVLSFVIVIGGIIAGYFSLTTVLAKSKAEISDRIRDDLSEENNLLRSRMQRVEEDNKHLRRIMELIVQTLKKAQKIDLEIDGDVVTLRYPNGNIQVNRLSD